MSAGFPSRTRTHTHTHTTHKRTSSVKRARLTRTCRRGFWICILDTPCVCVCVCVRARARARVCERACVRVCRCISLFCARVWRERTRVRAGRRVQSVHAAAQVGRSSARMRRGPPPLPGQSPLLHAHPHTRTPARSHGHFRLYTPLSFLSSCPVYLLFSRLPGPVPHPAAQGGLLVGPQRLALLEGRRRDKVVQKHRHHLRLKRLYIDYKNSSLHFSGARRSRGTAVACLVRAGTSHRASLLARQGARKLVPARKGARRPAQPSRGCTRYRCRTARQ